MTQTATLGFSSGTPAIALTPAQAAEKAQQRAALEKAAKGFEAIFVRQLVGSMRTASQGESIDGSSAVDQFQEMSDAHMAENLASNDGLGIAQMLLKSLDK
ncbi:MAG: rod-binding protein [Sphingobium sp.]|nr:rod-binding protein [Sphingobium sp.]